MIMSERLIFSDAQAITVSAASTSYLDLGAAGDAVEELYLMVGSVAAATADGAATITIALQTDDNTSFSSPTTLFATSAIGKASAAANTNLVKTRIPQGMQRYVRVYYTVATGPLTAGTFDAYLTTGPQTNS